MRRAQAPRPRRRKAHRQSGHAGLHCAEDAVGRRARARGREGDETRAASQGLRPPAPFRGSRVRYVRRLGDVLARCRQAALGRGPARRDWAFARRHAEAGRRLRGLGAPVAGDSESLGPRRAENSDRGRGRRQCRFGHRRRRDRAGIGFRLARHIGRRVLGHRPVHQPSRAHAARLLPCAPGPLARHVGDAVGRLGPVVDRGRPRPRARHRRSGRRGRSLRPHGERRRLRAGLPALPQRREDAA